MKIYVDKLPTKPNECIFKIPCMNYWGFWVNHCTFSQRDCVIESGRVCPYLTEFAKRTTNSEAESMSEIERLKECY